MIRVTFLSAKQDGPITADCGGAAEVSAFWAAKRLLQEYFYDFMGSVREVPPNDF